MSHCYIHKLYVYGRMLTSLRPSVTAAVLAAQFAMAVGDMGLWLDCIKPELSCRSRVHALHGLKALLGCRPYPHQ